MNVFVLGATGSIGTAVTAELMANGHTVHGLSRNETSDAKLTAAGASPVRGDLRDPRAWTGTLGSIDAVIHVAATFTEDMGQVDQGVIDAALDFAAKQARTIRFVYTGGCWLYGQTGERVALESGGFNPIVSFAWMVDHANRLLQAENLCTAIIHPAMVYHGDGDVFSRYVDSAKSGGPIEIWGSADTRWPLVHRDDLARAYRLVMEDRDLIGHFNAAAETGTPVADIVAAIAERHGVVKAPVVRTKESVLEEQGDWAEGPMLDQQMSSEKLMASCDWKPRHRSFRATI